jgi:hypothetical protein
MVHIVVVEKEDNAQGDPEGPIRNKGTVTEIVADFKFLVSGDQLGHATEYECQRNDRTDTTPAHVVELEQQGRDAESREPDDARVATWFCTSHKTSSFGKRLKKWSAVGLTGLER